ncbi:MAG: DUF4126 domain-containing protein [Flavobacteriales bacterium]|nr:DUF4126 domain-containing protein [Flavobacteriales bacterium]
MEFINQSWDSILSIFLGIGLAAAAGFRVFVPLFIVSLATHFGFGNYLDESPTWSWLGNTPTLIALGMAMFLEITAYFIPYVDNLLDTIAIPLAGIAGTFLMASQMMEFSPLFTWGLAIIAGGGTAMGIKSTISAGRVASTATTVGTGNFIVASTETATASFLGVLSIFLPVIAFAFAVFIAVYVCKFRKKLKRIFR